MSIVKKTFLVLFVLIPVFGFSQLSEAEKQTADQIHQLLQQKYPAEAPGGSVLVVKDGKTLLRNGYGVANLESRKPNTPETVFRIGSVTKQFTSTAILKLAEQGKINLEDNITQYLADYPVKDKKITIAHLLTHTSGIKSYTSLPRLMNKESKAAPVTVAAMINAFKDEPADFNPGDAYLYNNSGYFLLGAIIEKVSGLTWDEYLQRNFFTPLKMKSTFTDDKNIPLAASGYSKPGAYLPADYVHPSVPYSAGAIFSTVDDLWKWNNAIFRYKVVKKESLEKAWTPLALNSGIKQSYGYGWQLSKLDNKKVIAHGGAIDGFLSYALYVPETKTFVALLSNNMSVSPDELAYTIAGIASGVEEKKLTAISLDDKKLDEYAGVYQISDHEDRVISREGNQLYSRRTGSTRYEIFPYGPDVFFFKDSPSRLTFFRNADNTIQRLELSGREYVNQVALRTNKAMPAERKAISLDPAIFDTYVGQYEIAPNFIITMRREGTEFFSQATGQQSFEIFPETETRFFVKAFDAQLEFNKDATGKVSSVTLYQAGKTTPAKKISSELPRARTAVQINPVLYDRYTGEYELSPGFIITVRKENDKLLAQATGQGPAEIFPESETKFFYKIVDAQLEFITDASGNVSSLKLYQGNNIVTGKKK
jgi:CubicO group peptidase (beta-lactamase class C family)